MIDTSHSVIRALNFDQEDGFVESWGSGELSGIEDSSSSGDDLSSTSMDSISMECNILDVHSDTSHVFVSHDTFFGGPLEGSIEGILDFVQVLDGLGLIAKYVRSGGVGTESPNLHGVILVPSEFVNEFLNSKFLISDVKFFVFDGKS